MIKNLSPSRASQFKTCPKQFKFANVDKLKEPTNEPTPPRELRPTEDTLLPHDRERVEVDGGAIQPEFPQIEKQGSFSADIPTAG